MITLSISGLQRHDINEVKIMPRTVLLGPNGSGKSTILNCLRCAASGEVNVTAGNTPGALSAMSRDGMLTIQAAIEGGASTVQVIGSPRKNKVPHLGMKTAVANLAMSGTKEGIRAFFSEHLTPDPVADPKSIATKYGFKIPICNNLATDFATLLKAAMERTKAARAESARVSALAQGAASAQYDSVVVGSAKETRDKAAALAAEILSIEKDLAEYTNKREAYNATINSAAKAQQEFERMQSVAFPTLDEFAIEAAKGELREAELVRDNVKTLYEMDSYRLNEAKAELSQKKMMLHELDRRMQIAESGKCGSCGQSTDDKYIDAVNVERMKCTNEIVEAQARVAEIQSSKSFEDYAKANDAVTEKKINLEQVTRQVAEVRRAIHDHNINFARAESMAKAAVDAMSKIVAPPDSDDGMKESLQNKRKELQQLKETISQIEAAESAQKLAAQSRQRAADADAEYEKAKEAEREIKDARTACLSGPCERLAKVMNRFAPLLGCQEIIIDPGDDETDPTIGCKLDHGSIVPFVALSEAQRVAFLVAMSEQLLSNANESLSKKMLLIECGGFDYETLLGVLSKMFASYSINYVVIAWPCSSGTIQKTSEEIARMGWHVTRTDQ